MENEPLMSVNRKAIETGSSDSLNFSVGKFGEITEKGNIVVVDIDDSGLRIPVRFNKSGRISISSLIVEYLGLEPGERVQIDVYDAQEAEDYINGVSASHQANDQDDSEDDKPELQGEYEVTDEQKSSARFTSMDVYADEQREDLW